MDTATDFGDFEELVSVRKGRWDIMVEATGGIVYKI
jgi:hypothetical protein